MNAHTIMCLSFRGVMAMLTPRQSWIKSLLRLTRHWHRINNGCALRSSWFQVRFFLYHNTWFEGLLTYWGQVMYICVGKLTIIGSDNGLSPGWCQAIIWSSAGILFIGLLGTSFIEILIRIQTFSFKKMHLKMLLGNGVHFVTASLC